MVSGRSTGGIGNPPKTPVARKKTKIRRCRFTPPQLRRSLLPQTSDVKPDDVAPPAAAIDAARALSGAKKAILREDRSPSHRQRSNFYNLQICTYIIMLITIKTTS